MTSILKLHCADTDLYMNTELTNSLKNVFSKINIENKNQKWVVREGIGNFISTAGLAKNKNDQEHILELDGFQPLFQWIREQLLNNSSFLGQPDSTNIMFNHMWANIQFKDSEIRCHTHYKKHQIKNPTGVGIFYVNAPVNSGEFVVIKNGVFGTTIDEYKENECEFIKVKSGDLIIHDSLTPHAVSKHSNDEPRVCIVFDFHYTN